MNLAGWIKGVCLCGGGEGLGKCKGGWKVQKRQCQAERKACVKE